MEGVEQAAEVRVGEARGAEETIGLAEEITERAEERADRRLSLSLDTSQSKTMFYSSTVLAEVG